MRGRSWWPPVNSRARSSRSSTGMQWCYTPISRTRTIAVLEQGVTLLAKLGQSLSHISRNAAQGGALSPELQARLTQTHAVVAALERRTRDIARSALITWESRFD
jgi:hypothetical protein